MPHRVELLDQLHTFFPGKKHHLVIDTVHRPQPGLEAGYVFPDPRPVPLHHILEVRRRVGRC
ncbi:MAG: hypothetical protein J4F46_03445 [Dehalococcoidia bacterium]|nr:hypothetical protein [Dehalococcoidia bacterium]